MRKNSYFFGEEDRDGDAFSLSIVSTAGVEKDGGEVCVIFNIEHVGSWCHSVGGGTSTLLSSKGITLILELWLGWANASRFFLLPTPVFLSAI